MPMFDLKDAAGVMMELNACRKAHPEHYIRVNAFDSTRGVESMRAVLHRQPADGRARLRARAAGDATAARIRYTTRAYAADQPEGERYGVARESADVDAHAAALDRRSEPPSSRADLLGSATPDDAPATIDLQALLRDASVGEVLDELDRELVGLAPVKTRIREIAALLLVDARAQALGLAGADADAAHELHRQPRHRQDHGGAADGRDPAPAGLRPQGPPRRRDARRPGRPVHRPHRAQDQGSAEEGDGRRAVHRRGLLPLPPGERARLRPGGDRDPAAGDGEPARRPGRDPRRLRDRMDTFFQSNPGFRSRIAHHIDFPDYSDDELLRDRRD